MTTTKPVVLYVEDEESDRLLMQLAFAKAGLGSALWMVGDGKRAVEYLSGVGVFADRTGYPLPALVLLDLNLPGMHGFEVLKWIRAQPGYATLPVVVFTSSAQEEDRQRAESLGASAFIQKPVIPGGFQHFVSDLSASFLPPRSG